MGKMRRAEPTIIYKENEITKNIMPYISSIIITDNLEGTLDDVKISLINQKNIFLNNNWSPNKNERIEIGIKTLNWEQEKEGIVSKNFGIFYIDEKEFSKKTATWKGISAPLNSKNVKNSKTWESVTLNKLGEEIANKYNLEYQFFLESEINLKDLQQEKQTDFSFLNKIALEEGIKLKITNKKLVLFEESEFQKKETSIILDLKKVEDFRIKDKSNDIYDAVEVKEFDKIAFKETKVIITKEELEGKEPGQANKILKINTRSKSQDLYKYALKKLQQVNKQENMINITMVGDLRYYAGIVINIINAGIYSGRYMIKKVIHKLPNFTTEIETYKIGDFND